MHYTCHVQAYTYNIYTVTDLLLTEGLLLLRGDVPSVFLRSVESLVLWVLISKGEESLALLWGKVLDRLGDEGTNTESVSSNDFFFLGGGGGDGLTSGFLTGSGRGVAFMGSKDIVSSSTSITWASRSSRNDRSIPILWGALSGPAGLGPVFSDTVVGGMLTTGAGSGDILGVGSGDILGTGSDDISDSGPFVVPGPITLLATTEEGGGVVVVLEFFSK